MFIRVLVAIIIIISAVSVPQARLTQFYLIFMNTLIYRQQHAPFLQEDSSNTKQLGSGKIKSQTQACLITKFWLLRTKKAEPSESDEPKLLDRVSLGIHFILGPRSVFQHFRILPHQFLL